MRPCLRLFYEDMALPSAVMGPFDLAPLIRAMAAFDMRVSYYSSWHASWWVLLDFEGVLLQIQVDINFPPRNRIGRMSAIP